MNIIEPKSGRYIYLNKGDHLKVVDVEGEQVSDIFCIMSDDHSDYLSSGRTIDYLSRLTFKVGDKLYSSKSIPMLRIIEDTVGVHDFILTPCSSDTFEIIYGDKDACPGCEGNIVKALNEHGIVYKSLPPTFNIFMNVKINDDREITVNTPTSKKGDYIVFEALADMHVALTACSALQSNGGSFKPIGYAVNASSSTGAGKESAQRFRGNSEP